MRHSVAGVCAAPNQPGLPLGWPAADELELSRVADALAGGASDTPALRWLRKAIASGNDPLGDAFCRLRSPRDRRRQGAVYTPPPIVAAMLRWATAQGEPARVVDPGAGSGRFLLAAGRAFPDARLVAVETDPMAVRMLRANAVVCGLAERLSVVAADYRTAELPAIGGTTLFLGNPPYVRHHDIQPRWKDWFGRTAAAHGIKASRLAGLHVHFALHTCSLARPGDYGAFITAAEWLDVNYGSAMRHALLDVLGGQSVHLLAPSATPFPDADATGAIFSFRVGKAPRRVWLRRVPTLSRLGSLDGGRGIERARLAAAQRWSPLFDDPKIQPRDGVELGELCRVHRGQVTGCNAVWIAGKSPHALPDRVLAKTVTRAKELFSAGPVLSSVAALRLVVDLPANLDELDSAAREDVERFLGWAKEMGAHEGYVARHRRAWWSVGLREPAPLLCTYMARRPPAFVRNALGARHLNIAHGLYPRQPLAAETLDALAAWLRANVCTSSGRTYAGGLTKFEPKEVERLLIPPLEEMRETLVAA